MGESENRRNSEKIQQKERQRKTENALYGICIDIGTTTLAALLVNLETEADCQTAVSVNHQRAYGSDVLSRISASNSGKKWEIQRCIRQDLQKLIRELLQKKKDNGTADTKDRDRRKHNDVSSASRIFM